MEVEVVVVEHDNLETMAEAMDVDQMEDDDSVQLQQHQTRKRSWLELEFSVATIHDKSWASSACKRTKIHDEEEEEERAHQQRKRCWLEFSSTTIRDKSWDSCSLPTNKRAKKAERTEEKMEEKMEEKSERPATRPHRQQRKGKRCHLERG
jgi:hypothetical protein